jgi:hypothetical protein
MNIFNFFLITKALILFKFDLKHLWDKVDINCEFQAFCPFWGLWGRTKSVNNGHLKKKNSSFLKVHVHVCKKNVMNGDVEQEGLYQNCEFIILGVEVLYQGQGHI